MIGAFLPGLPNPFEVITKVVQGVADTGAKVLNGAGNLLGNGIQTGANLLGRGLKTAANVAAIPGTLAKKVVDKVLGRQQPPQPQVAQPGVNQPDPYAGAYQPQQPLYQLQQPGYQPPQYGK